MNVTVKRDGIQLQGILERAEGVEKGPALILFHGFTGDLGYTKDNMFTEISEKVNKLGITTVRFDFDGHGKSEGLFADMDVLREILDAIEILKYVRSLPFVTDIYVLGHSQGGVVGGILSGLYPDVVKKLVLMAPAATLKDDAIKGTCMGVTYDTEHIPDQVKLYDPITVGGHYFRIAKNLPIYEVTSNYHGEMLIIHGIADEVVDYHASERYHECLPQSNLKLYETMDHGIGGQEHEQAIEEVINFLK